jgi:hypothetical protein
LIVEAVRGGESQRAVARRFRVSLRMVQRWMQRAAGQDVAAVDWADRSHRPHTIHRTPATIEDKIVRLRQQLRDTSALGEYGDQAIHRALLARGARVVPSVRTIARILVRRGALERRRRVRRPPPPAGWYLPDVVAKLAEVDLVDAIEDLVLEGGIHIDVLTCVSLHGGLPGAWPGPVLTTKFALEALVEHWRVVGLPAYVQVDNDPRFTGGHRYPGVLGRFGRVCLSLGVSPIFAPPYESGFQAAIESLNARWQAKVWHRFHHDSPADLGRRSARSVRAYRQRIASRLDAAPARHHFPAQWASSADEPQGRVVYIRRTDALGVVPLLGYRLLASRSWPQRLVRCEVGFPSGRVTIYALRRRDPPHQPLLRTTQIRWRRRWTSQ